MGNPTRTPAPAVRTTTAPASARNSSTATPPTQGQTTTTTVQTNGSITVTVGAGGTGTTSTPNSNKTNTNTPARPGSSTTVVTDTGQRVVAAGGAGASTTQPVTTASPKAANRTPAPVTPSNAGTSLSAGTTARVATSTVKAAAPPPQPVTTTSNKSAAASRPSTQILTPIQIQALSDNERRLLINVGGTSFAKPTAGLPVASPKAGLRPSPPPPPPPPRDSRVDVGAKSRITSPPPPPSIPAPTPTPSAPAGNGGAVSVVWQPTVVAPTPDRIETFQELVTETIPAQYRTLSEDIYAPTYESRNVKRGGQGSGGGFSYKRVKVNAGDVITIIVGATGDQFKGGVGPGIAAQYKGGDAGTSTPSIGGRGGGGGAASVILVNGVVVAVAAGGGGGAGGTINAQGADGRPTRNSGIGTSKIGASSSSGGASGGGGGGGFWGGEAGQGGTIAVGGQGGVNLGTIIETGSGITPGGITSEFYPAGGVGYASNHGAAVIGLYKEFAVKIRIKDDWKQVDSAYVKIENSWREIYQGWVKVSGQWAPLVVGNATPTPTYTLAANLASVDEGQAVRFTLSTANVAVGTAVPWSATGLPQTDLQVGSLTGTFVTGTTDSIVFVPRVDWNTTGQRTLLVSLNQAPVSASVTVNDTTTSNAAPAISYSITPSRIDVEEGTQLTANVSTVNFGSGLLYWSIDGTVTNPRNYWSATSGTVIVQSNTGSVTLRSKFNASASAYTERFNIRLRRGSTVGTIVASSSQLTLSKVQNIPEVALTEPTYRLVPTSTGMIEGGNLRINVSTTDFGNGTLYWTVSHVTTNSSDFATNSGSVVLTNDAGALYVNAASDALSEGSETFTVQLRTGATDGAVVATTSSLTLADTTPPAPVPSYSVTYNSRTGLFTRVLPGEGQTLRFTVNTSDVGSATLYWTVNNITTSNGDFVATNGSVSIVNDTGSISLQTVADLTTEGSESFSLQIRTGSTSGPVVATSSTVTLTDTSRTPSVYTISRTSATVNEGATATFNVSVTDFGSGTLYATVNSTTMTAADFTAETLTYRVDVVNGTATVSVGIKADLITDGSESFTMQLREGSSSGTVLAESQSVTINDTSLTVSGNQSWTTPGSFTWTVPAGVTSVYYRVIGGGGGGGGGAWTGGPTAYGGGGGGSGGIQIGNLAVVPGSTINVKVGRGGSGGTNYVYNTKQAPTASATAGGDGGASQFSSIAVAGGKGGSQSGGGGAGGGGNAGGPGIFTSATTVKGQYNAATVPPKNSQGGAGGSVPGYGAGGAGGISSPGTAGTGPGGGGGGGGTFNQATPASGKSGGGVNAVSTRGGAGAAGSVYISWG